MLTSLRFSLLNWEYFVNYSKWIDNFAEVLNLDWLSLKLNWFMNNYSGRFSQFIALFHFIQLLHTKLPYELLHCLKLNFQNYLYVKFKFLDQEVQLIQPKFIFGAKGLQMCRKLANRLNRLLTHYFQVCTSKILPCQDR